MCYYVVTPVNDTVPQKRFKIPVHRKTAYLITAASTRCSLFNGLFLVLSVVIRIPLEIGHLNPKEQSSLRNCSPREFNFLCQAWSVQRTVYQQPDLRAISRYVHTVVMLLDCTHLECLFSPPDQASTRHLRFSRSDTLYASQPLLFVDFIR